MPMHLYSSKFSYLSFLHGNSSHRPVGRVADATTLPTVLWAEMWHMETLPTGLWVELQMLQLYPHTYGKRCGNSSHRPCGKRCGNSSHRPVGRVVDATTLPTGLWEEMWQLSHRPVGRDVTTLPTGLWEEL
jgi:hypothetical protein